MAKMEKPRPCPICGVTEDEYNPHGKLECIPGLVAEVARLNLQLSESEKAHRETSELWLKEEREHEVTKRLNEELKNKGLQLTGFSGELLLLIHEVIRASKATGEYIGQDGQLIKKLKCAVGTHHFTDYQCDWCGKGQDMEKRVVSGPKSCHACIDCQETNAPHECGCHE